MTDFPNAITVLWTSSHHKISSTPHPPI